MLRLIHNRAIVKYVLAFAIIGIAAYFAWAAFPVGHWMGEKFMPHDLGGPEAFGLIAAIVMGILVLILGFYKEYLAEDSKAYSLASGNPSFESSFKWFVWIVLGLEFCSVAFRWFLVDWSPVGFIILAFGIVLMGVTYVLSKQLHVQMNRHPSVAAAHMRNAAGTQVFEDGEKLVRGRKFSISQLRRIASGDPQPIDDLRDEKAREREEEVAKVRARNRAAEDEQARNRDFYTRMVSPTPLIEQPSSNGRDPH